MGSPAVLSDLRSDIEKQIKGTYILSGRPGSESIMHIYLHIFSGNINLGVL